MSFPETRMRRLRRTESLRALVRETAVTPGDLIYPLFLCPGEGVRREVGSMPGVFNLSVDEAVREAEEAARLGLGGLLLFGLPENKDEQGSGAYDDNGIVQQGLRALKASPAAKKLVLIADVCPSTALKSKTIRPSICSPRPLSARPAPALTSSPPAT
jgi:porphobilinogen synthase